MELPLIQGKLQQAQAHKAALENTHKQHSDQLRANHVQQQMQKLRNEGYGHIVEKGKDSETFKYISQSLSADAANIIALDADAVIMADKARLWDESQGKGKKAVTKRSSTKTLRGTRKAQPVSAKKSPANAHIEVSGGQLDQDTDSFLDDYFAGRG